MWLDGFDMSIWIFVMVISSSCQSGRTALMWALAVGLVIFAVFSFAGVGSVVVEYEQDSEEDY